MRTENLSKLGYVHIWWTNRAWKPDAPHSSWIKMNKTNMYCLISSWKFCCFTFCVLLKCFVVIFKALEGCHTDWGPFRPAIKAMRGLEWWNWSFMVDFPLWRHGNLDHAATSEGFHVSPFSVTEVRWNVMDHWVFVVSKFFSEWQHELRFPDKRIK